MSSRSSTPRSTATPTTNPASPATSTASIRPPASTPPAPSSWPARCWRSRSSTSSDCRGTRRSASTTPSAARRPCAKTRPHPAGGPRSPTTSASNRLYEFVGQQHMNEGLWEKAYRDVRLTHRLAVPRSSTQNRHTNPFTIYRGDQVLHRQGAALRPGGRRLRLPPPRHVHAAPGVPASAIRPGDLVRQLRQVLPLR